jgi:hypothetical protein
MEGCTAIAEPPRHVYDKVGLSNRGNADPAAAVEAYDDSVGRDVPLLWIKIGRRRGYRSARPGIDPPIRRWEDSSDVQGDRTCDHRDRLAEVYRDGTATTEGSRRGAYTESGIKNPHRLDGIEGTECRRWASTTRRSRT